MREEEEEVPQQYYNMASIAMRGRGRGSYNHTRGNSILTQHEKDAGLVDRQIIIKTLRIYGLQTLRKKNQLLLYVKSVVKIITLL